MAVEEASSSGGEEGSGSGSGSGGWTREQEKAFENAVAAAGEEAPEGDAAWEEMAAAVEGKTAEEVRRHYELLVEDVDGIESGRVPLLVYAGDAAGEEGVMGRRCRRPSPPSRSAGRASPGPRTSTGCSFLDLRSMAKVTGGASQETL